MGKFGCTCGQIISDGLIPNEVTGSILSDKSADRFYENLSEVVTDFLTHQSQNQLQDWRTKHFNDVYPQDLPPGEMIHDILFGRLMSLTLEVMECDNCGRLWIQEAVGVNQWRGYSPDDAAESRMKVLGLNNQTPIIPPPPT
jgi:hypothetical protein